MIKYAYIFLLLSLISFFTWYGNSQYTAGENAERAFWQARIIEINREATARLQATQGAVVAANSRYNQAVTNERNREAELDETKRQLRLARRPDNCDGGHRNEPDYRIYRMYNAAADSPDLPAGDYLKRPDPEADGLDAIQDSARETIDARLYAIALIGIIEAGITNGCYTVATH